MKKKVFNIGLMRIFILITIMALTNFKTFAQATESESTETEEAMEEVAFAPAMEMTTLKKSDKSRDITVILKGEGEETFPVKDAQILIYNTLGDKKVELGKIKTNALGIATINIKDGYTYLKDADHKINFLAQFEGSDGLEAIEATKAVKDLEVSFELNEVDSIKSLHITANIIGANGELIPLNETEIGVYIQGHYSRLQIDGGNAFLTEGECDFEFPTDLKGDHKGNLDIYVGYDNENEDFGAVEMMKSANWGTHRGEPAEEVRELWTRGAPMWMIVTLTIMLLGVWSHYTWAVIQLFLIRKEGKKLKKS